MIVRIWHGYTNSANADAYESLLKTKIFPYIQNKNIPGYRQIELLKRPFDGGFEFVTIMQFDSMDDVINFAGEDYEKAVVLPEAEALLERFDARSQHYQVLESLKF